MEIKKLDEMFNELKKDINPAIIYQGIMSRRQETPEMYQVWLKLCRATRELNNLDFTQIVAMMFGYGCYLVNDRLSTKEETERLHEVLNDCLH